MSRKDDQMQIPEVLPLIPLRDLIVFPNLVVPLFVGRERSISALEQCMRTDHLVALVTQRQAETQDPGPGDIYDVGCVANGGAPVCVTDIEASAVAGPADEVAPHVTSAVLPAPPKP
mgnify:CR=1 FL=1